MESAPIAQSPTDGVEDKGLKKNAIGFVSSVVIGVASTAPGYSLAAVLGLAAAAVGLQSPAIMIVAFLPMLFIAAAYYYMNRTDPDCGTTFAWVTKAMGPWAGWIGGWAIIVADIIVMANLAQIAGLYSFLLVDANNLADSTFWVTFVGVIWIVIMTAICVIGIELSARTQVGLLGAELITLAIFAVVALVKVYSGDALAGSIEPQLSWFNPFDISSFDALISGVLIAVFIYWGWDSTVTVNEETESSSTTPGRAAVVSTIILVFIYVIVSTAAQAYGGVDQLVENSDDVLSALGSEVFGSPWDKLLIIAVLTSAAASTQTTILPTARTSLSMARAKAIPESLGHVSPRFMTPHVSTILMGVFSIAWYVGLTIASENILYDSIAALGLMIAFYYGITGYACPIYYRTELFRDKSGSLGSGLLLLASGLLMTAALILPEYDTGVEGISSLGEVFDGTGGWLIGLMLITLGLSALWALLKATNIKRMIMIGFAPITGGVLLTYVFLKSCIDYADPANATNPETDWIGLGPPLVIGIGFLIFGVLLMLLWWATGHREFFKRRPGTVDAEVAATAYSGN